MMSPTKATAQIARISRRSVPRTRSRTATAPTPSPRPSADRDPGVDHAVEEVDDEVDEDIDDGDEEDPALGNREVAALERADEHPADPLAGEDLLDDDRAGQQPP